MNSARSRQPDWRRREDRVDAARDADRKKTREGKSARAERWGGEVAPNHIFFLLFICCTVSEEFTRYYFIIRGINKSGHQRKFTADV